MPTEVRHRMETGQPLPVVRLSGVLDLDAVARSRAQLHASLVEHAGPLVLDLSELTVADREAAVALGEVLRSAADWPAVDLALCAPEPDAWLSTHLPVRRDLESALAVLSQLRPTRRLTMLLEPRPGAARRARELVTEACARWELPALAGPACIVITEMVNNVVAHAGTAMTVRLALRDGCMAVAVQDADPRAPQARGPVPPTAYGGRGLLLIDAVSRRWGSATFDDGKVVWAVLDPEDELDDLTTV